MSTTLTASGNVTNTGTATLTVGPVLNNPGNLTLQMNLLKVSGTVAGTSVPQASLDGTNYFTIPSGNGGSSYTNTDTTGTQCTGWCIKDCKAPYYRILITGSGTMVATPTGSMILDQE